MYYTNEGGSQIVGAFVTVDGSIIKCKNNNTNAMISLMAAYYTFDLEYPEIYCQFLGFLQEKMLGLPYTYKKSTNFMLLSSKLGR